MNTNIYAMNEAEISYELADFPEGTAEKQLWYDTIQGMQAVRLGWIDSRLDQSTVLNRQERKRRQRDHTPSRFIRCVEQADKQLGTMEKGWPVLEGSAERVGVARLARAHWVQIEKYKLTPQLPWIASMQSTEFTIGGNTIDVKTFDSVFAAYCRSKNVGKLTSVKRAAWFCERRAVDARSGSYKQATLCKTASHWAEILEHPVDFEKVTVLELIELASVAPTSVALKNYLSQTEKLFAKIPEPWSALPDEIQRDHVRCCQQFEVACPFLSASLGQIKQALTPERPNYEVLYRAATGKGIYPPGTTGKTLAGKKRLQK